MIPGSKSAPPTAWILYDGACGFCARWVRAWQKVLSKRGFQIIDLQTASTEGLILLPPDALLDDIRILTREGTLVSGADAYLYAWERIWWAVPLFLIFGLPGFYQLLWAGYRWFNRNRYRISRHCPLPPERDKPAS